MSKKGRISYTNLIEGKKDVKNMCGITGYVDFKKTTTAIEIKKMTETLSRRGPDESGYWSEGGIHFGHRRLTVVDASGGKQPMMRIKDGKKFVLVYNGELYNTEEIRKELMRKGYKFEGYSDTEVLLQSYIEWEEQCVNKFNGIFAFAVWDERKQQVFLARDRLGVKPLFYTVQDDKLIFGSEIKSITASGVKLTITSDGLGELLALGPSKRPGSGIYKNFKELRPAHCMTFDKNGLKVKRYWQVQSQVHLESYAETVQRVRDLVIDAIERQLVSDVPVCTFLSGGLDSSAITAIAANKYAATGAKLNTFSVDYADNEKYFKESVFQPNTDQRFIKKMSDAFKLHHTNVVLSQAELIDSLEEATYLRDFPGMADIDSSLLQFCKEIRKGYVVALSGECADEIFGGYPWFYREDELKSDTFPWIRSTNERSDLLNDFYKKSIDIEAIMRTSYDETLMEVPYGDEKNGHEAARKNMSYLNMIWFMTTLLERKDRMSMGASIEVRVPFADHRLVEYAWNIPWEMKMSNGREKGILRDALDGILPEEIVSRKKSPYPKTHNPEYTKLVQSKLAQIVASENSVVSEIFSRQKLDELIQSGGSSFKKPWYGQLMSGPQLLAYLIQFHYWFEKNRIDIEL